MVEVQVDVILLRPDTTAFTDLDGRQWRLEDHVEGAAYDRDGCDLRRQGLYLDARPWQASVFTLRSNSSRS